MFRDWIRSFLLRPVNWATRKLASKPRRIRIFKALDALYEQIQTNPGKRGLVIPFAETEGRFIIFSDQHKGARDGADDFAIAEPVYLEALKYYNRQDYQLICLGDSEELWENGLSRVKKMNTQNFELERAFLARKAFVKIFGNHDLYWDNDPFAWWQLKDIYKQPLKVYEGVILTTLIEGRSLKIFCTHGHQGDAQSDGNWFSKWFVAQVWAPLQGYLRINPNTPAYDSEKKTLHNEIMYEWSATRSDTLLITGHTHQPVFASLTHLERLYKQLQKAIAAGDNDQKSKLETEIRLRESEFTTVSVDYLQMKPSYFNTGCCCFADGDITGIEIENGYIRLVKWSSRQEGLRMVLEERSLKSLKV
ncbi:MAG: metallophosphoesterase [Sphingobacteriales bacterium]|nr:metallophosphoesterase [Sphingobacteriales bacterium]OJW31716.1 MAG: metallophosphoesterase [Sphingobacteriales bacterium 46-32]